MAGRGLNITIEGLEELGADLSRIARPGLRNAIMASLRGKGGQALVSELRLRTPKRTGALAASIRISDTGDTVKVGTDLPHGSWIESGVGGHVIRAKNGGSLFFAGHSVKRVIHPGFKGRFVAKKSLKAAEWEVLADIVDEIDRIANV